MSFEIITVVVVVIIFGIFTYAAGRAEKTVKEKFKAQREAQARLKPTAKSTTPVKSGKATGVRK